MEAQTVFIEPPSKKKGRRTEKEKKIENQN